MSERSGRADAGAAVAGLFASATATGGLAGRPARAGARAVTASGTRVRLGVELTDEEIGFLRGLSRPARTGGSRTLGSKFVGTGVLAAAIALLGSVEVDMVGLTAGDLDDMTKRAHDALLRAAAAERAAE